MRMITMSLKMEVTEPIKIFSKQKALIIHRLLFSSNFRVGYEGYDIFELWTLSGKLYLPS